MSETQNKKIEQYLNYLKSNKINIIPTFKIEKVFYEGIVKYLFVPIDCHKTVQDFFSDLENKLYYRKEAVEEERAFNKIGIDFDKDDYIDLFPHRDTFEEAESDMERFIDFLLV